MSACARCLCCSPARGHVPTPQACLVHAAVDAGRLDPLLFQQGLQKLDVVPRGCGGRHGEAVDGSTCRLQGGGAAGIRRLHVPARPQARHCRGAGRCGFARWLTGEDDCQLVGGDDLAQQEEQRGGLVLVPASSARRAPPRRSSSGSPQGEAERGPGTAQALGAVGMCVRAGRAQGKPAGRRWRRLKRRSPHPCPHRTVKKASERSGEIFVSASSRTCRGGGGVVAGRRRGGGCSGPHVRTQPACPRRQGRSQGRTNARLQA